MTLNSLLKERRLLRQVPAVDEIQGLFDLARRSFADAQVAGLSIDWRYMIAYNAALSLSAVVLRAEPTSVV